MHVAAVTELLERERELGVLDATLARVQARSGVAILIEGPPGVGKSALLAAPRSSTTSPSAWRDSCSSMS